MTLALIAGTGDLPPALIDRLPARPLICAMRGFEPDLTVDVAFRIENLGSFLNILRDRGVTEVCMAGAIRRPDIDVGLIDAPTAPLVPHIMKAIGSGDDGALRSVISIFEQAGLKVRAAHEIAPDLLPPAGVLGQVPLTEAAISDATVGEACVRQMGAADIGQACVVRDAQVLLQEDERGTDAMLAPYAPYDVNGFGAGDDLRTLKDEVARLSGRKPGIRGALLFKAPKPTQDRRADLPVIGPQTAVAASRARLSGIVVEADGVMVLDLPAVLHICDAFGMFLWVRPRGTG